jgi:hypothetical protein
MMKSPQPTTIGDLRASGLRGLLICCGDDCCEYSISIDADRWSDGTRLSDLEDKFTCPVCGARGANVRADFD